MEAVGKRPPGGPDSAHRDTVAEVKAMFNSGGFTRFQMSGGTWLRACETRV